jgi:hypothetical protein
MRALHPFFDRLPDQTAVIERQAAALQSPPEQRAHTVRTRDEPVDLVKLACGQCPPTLRRRHLAVEAAQQVLDLGKREARRLGYLDNA